jgi:hypothetical protein
VFVRVCGRAFAACSHVQTCCIQKPCWLVCFYACHHFISRYSSLLCWGGTRQSQCMHGMCCWQHRWLMTLLCGMMAVAVRMCQCVLAGCGCKSGRMLQIVVGTAFMRSGIISDQICYVLDRLCCTLLTGMYHLLGCSCTHVALHHSRRWSG